MKRDAGHTLCDTGVPSGSAISFWPSVVDSSLSRLTDEWIARTQCEFLDL